MDQQKESPQQVLPLQPLDMQPAQPPRRHTLFYLIVVLLSVLYLLHLYRSALQGMGDTVIPMLSGIAELTMRIGCALLLPIWLGQYGIYFAEIAAWAGAVVILVTFYYIRIHHLLHGIPDKRIHVTHDGMVVNS